ncbi:MAG TPA: hypothetical protein VK880_00110 [Anaerolineales bacterium]|nr:hypothetical protein [Anaerolineales bacterium]
MENGKWKLIISFTAFACVMVLVFTSFISTSANPDSVIDFEGLPEGSIVSSVSYGNGISGDPVSGEVAVFGYNPVFGPDTNAAMIFDAACLPEGTPEGCTGGDSDLFWPKNGNVLIISEDMDSSDPNDADVPGAFFEFDYSNWGTGKVTVHSMSVQDVETEEAGDATLKLFSGGLGGTLLAEIPIPETGDGMNQDIPINVSGVDAMQVDLDGSGAITNISITPYVITPPTPTSTPITPTSTPSEPTAIELLYFRVDEVVGQQVKLTWATSAEIDHYGFRLYRSQDNNFSSAEPIHFQAGANNVAGSTYAFTDTFPNTGSWWYWLADIDHAGRETIDSTFNPVFADVASNHPAKADFVIFLPMTVVEFEP